MSWRQDWWFRWILLQTYIPHRNCHLHDWPISCWLHLQGQGTQYSGIVNCAQTILREEGPRAFLKVKRHLHCMNSFNTSRQFIALRWRSLALLACPHHWSSASHVWGCWISCALSSWSDYVGKMAGHWAASAVDRHRWVHLLWCAGENQVYASWEEEPRSQGRMSEARFGWLIHIAPEFLFADESSSV